MNLYSRPRGPKHNFTVYELADPLTLQQYAAWEEFLLGAGVAPPSLTQYTGLEDVESHYLAIHKRDIIGTLQVNKDNKGRLHLHRLVVALDWREKGVATEMVRQADFDYDDEELFAHTNPGDAMDKLLDMFLFTENSDVKPENFEITTPVDQNQAVKAEAEAAPAPRKRRRRRSKSPLSTPLPGADAK